MLHSELSKRDCKINHSEDDSNFPITCSQQLYNFKVSIIFQRSTAKLNQ